MSVPDPEARTQGRSTYLGLAAFISASAAVPFLLVSVPPLLDLPQHLDQARLFLDVSGGAHAGDLETVWLRPQNLIYALLVPLWLALPPLVAGKVFAYTLLLASIGSLFHLARRRERSAEGALLASLFLFNFSFYSGLFAHQLGASLFLVWLARSDSRVDRREWVIDAVLLALMAWAHVLWFGLAMVVLVGRVAAFERTRQGLLRLTTSVFVGAWAVIAVLDTIQSRVSGGFDPAPFWAPLAWRLAPDTILDTMLGGVRGWAEPVCVALLVLWVAGSLQTNRGTLRERVDPLLAGVAVLLALLWLTAPNTLASSVLLSRRWLPYACMLTVLAVPAPKIDPSRLRVAVVAVVTVFVLATGSAWHFHDRVELRGLMASVAVVPQGSRVLGLDFLKFSTVLKGRPFLQAFSWAGPLRGSPLSLSFTQLGGLVNVTENAPPPWTSRLEWNAEAVLTSDFQYFDFVIVGGTEPDHRQVLALPMLHPAGGSTPWAVYRVADGPSDPGAASPAGVTR